MIGLNSMMKNNNDSKKRVVAFLDVLGFKAMIEKYTLEELSKKYESLIDKTNSLISPFPLNENVPRLFPKHPQNKPWCHKQIFSDSIILISDSDSDESCLRLLIYAWRLTQVCISSHMPVRGAITFGDLYVNFRKSIVLGKALTKAYDLEEKQNWIGVSIDRSLEKRFSKLFALCKDQKSFFYPIFFRYDVPLKNDLKIKLHTLNWRLNLIVEKGTKSLFRMSRNSEINKKINNTLDYARVVVKSGHIYDWSDDLAVELRAFLHGSKKWYSNPPIHHGDEL